MLLFIKKGGSPSLWSTFSPALDIFQLLERDWSCINRSVFHQRVALWQLRTACLCNVWRRTQMKIRHRIQIKVSKSQALEFVLAEELLTLFQLHGQAFCKLSESCRHAMFGSGNVTVVFCKLPVSFCRAHVSFYETVNTPSVHVLSSSLLPPGLLSRGHAHGRT